MINISEKSVKNTKIDLKRSGSCCRIRQFSYISYDTTSTDMEHCISFRRKRLE